MAKDDPKHVKAAEDLLKLQSAEQRRRIKVANYKQPDYVAAEVLVKVVRARFGKATGVLDTASTALSERMNVLIGSYFAKNPQWRPVVNASSETLKEAVMYAWKILLEDEQPVSFAEVRFLPWVEARAQDFLQSQLAQKNQARSLEAMTVHDQDGKAEAYADTLEGDSEDSPEAAYEREQLESALKGLWFDMERPLRQAIFFRLVCKYEWTAVAELLGCSVPTARKNYKLGIEQLIGAME